MPLNIEIRRDVLFAPQKHVSVWALNPAYVSLRGPEMVLTVTETDGHGLGANRYPEWTTTWRRFLSLDNGKQWFPVNDARLTPLTAERKMTHVGYEGPWAYWLEPSAGWLIGFHSTPRFDDEFVKPPRSRFLFNVSGDGGLSWQTARPIIHTGDGCDAHRWMPQFDPEKNMAQFDQPHPITLDDGTLLFGFTQKMPRYVTRFFRGQWSERDTTMQWEVSQPIGVPVDVSSTGPCEPDLLSLGGQRVLATMRAQGIPAKQVPSSRQCSVSEDGGRTWSRPQPLKYDDGTPVWVPAALSAFQRHPASGRIFWFANIQSQPVYGQLPRYPLTMAEFDPQRMCLKRDSVTVIQDLPPGAPPAGDPKQGQLGRRYSNFGHYVDRETNEFVILVPEEPRTTWDDLWADCVRYRIALRT